MYKTVILHPLCAKCILPCATVIITCAVAGCAVEPTTANVLPATSARVAFQSPCAQNAIECTSSWPTAIASVEAREGQTVTTTTAGFLVNAPGSSSSVPVQFVGDDSILGNDATILNYSWTYGASQDDPCFLTPGEEFAITARPIAHLAPGLHYIRLTVENDIVRDTVESPVCGIFGTDITSFDFIEFEVEIRN